MPACPTYQGVYAVNVSPIMDSARSLLRAIETVWENVSFPEFTFDSIPHRAACDHGRDADPARAAWEGTPFAAPERRRTDDERRPSQAGDRDRRPCRRRWSGGRPAKGRSPLRPGPLRCRAPPVDPDIRDPDPVSGGRAAPRGSTPAVRKRMRKH